jgi:hypothetical protein
VRIIQVDARACTQGLQGGPCMHVHACVSSQLTWYMYVHVHVHVHVMSDQVLT